MTCIVSLVDEKKKLVYMGADTAATGGDQVTIIKQPKIFFNNGFMFGCCGSLRMLQLLAYGWKPPRPKKTDDLAAFMAVKFMDHTRHLFKMGGYASKEAEAELGGRFLVAVKGRVFEVQSDYNVSENVINYAAIGSGEFYALGSLFTSANSNLSQKDRVTVALEAAAEFSASVRGPFNIATMKG